MKANPIESQKEAILKTHAALCQKYGKAYHWATQRKELKLIAKWHHIKMSIRTLNRRLAELEEEGYISRTKRHTKGPNGKILFRSTLTKMGGRAFNWLYQQGHQAARFFSVFHLPKLAQYALNTAGYSSSVGYPAGLINSAPPEGAARNGPIHLSFRTV